MPYTPLLYQPTQPLGTVDASTADDEFRMIKRSKYLTVPVDDMPGADPGIQANNAIAEILAADINGILVWKNDVTYEVVTPIEFHTKRNILMCSNGPGGGGQCTRLLWQGGAASGPMISIKGSNSLIFRDLTFQYDEAAYADKLVIVEDDGVGTQCYKLLFERVAFLGSSGAIDNAMGVQIQDVYNLTFRDCLWNYLTKGIHCPGVGVTNVKVEGGLVESGMVTSAFDIAGTTFNISDVTQQSAAGGAALVPFLTLAGLVNVLNLKGNTLGVDSSGAGIAVDLTAAGCYGGSLLGNTFSGGLTTSVAMNETFGLTSSLLLSGNYFNSDAGVGLGRSNAIAVIANHFSCTNPVSGTEPTNLVWTGNDTDITSINTKLNLPAGAKKALTPPGSSHSGMGKFTIAVRSIPLVFDVAVLGASGTTAILSASNPALVSTTPGAASINVFWDAAYSGGAGAYVIENGTGLAHTYMPCHIGI